MIDLYFAYGSNMPTARMRERVPDARALARARLAGFELRIDKRGRDGSAKANLARNRDHEVWGVVYRLHSDHWPTLDGFEAGYERIEVEVSLEARRVRALTYASSRVAAGQLPFGWYRALMIEGAREHGLPTDWLNRLHALPARTNEPSAT